MASIKTQLSVFRWQCGRGCVPPPSPPPSSVKQTRRPLIVQRRLFELNAFFFFFKCDINETSFFFFSFCKLFSFLCIKSWLFLVWFFFFFYMFMLCNFEMLLRF